MYGQLVSVCFYTDLPDIWLHTRIPAYQNVYQSTNSRAYKQYLPTDLLLHATSYAKLILSSIPLDTPTIAPPGMSGIAMPYDTSALYTYERIL